MYAVIKSEIKSERSEPYFSPYYKSALTRDSFVGTKHVHLNENGEASSRLFAP